MTAACGKVACCLVIVVAYAETQNKTSVYERKEVAFTVLEIVNVVFPYLQISKI